jgi:hypothetical protein
MAGVIKSAFPRAKISFLGNAYTKGMPPNKGICPFQGISPSAFENNALF